MTSGAADQCSIYHTTLLLMHHCWCPRVPWCRIGICQSIRKKNNDKSIVIGSNLLPLHGTSVSCFNICTGIAFAKIWTLIVSFEKKTNQLIPGSSRSMPRFWDTWSWLLKAVVKSLWKWSSLIWNQVAGWPMPFSFFHPYVLDRLFFLQEKIRTICTMLQKNWSAWPIRPLIADHCCPLVRDLEN